MRGLAEYVMRGRKQAVLMVLLFNLLPFMGWISDAILALVTLRKGVKEGVLVLLWAILPSVVLAVVGYPQVWFYNILGGSLIIYLLALILRNTSSWQIVLYTGMLLGVASVILVHIYNPDITNAWSQQLAGYIKNLQAQWGPTTVARMQEALPRLAKIGTGLQLAFLLLSNLFVLAFARYWQALLYNPNGWRIELENIRLGFIAIGLLGILLVASMLDSSWAIDSMPVALVPFVLAGLSLLHYAVKQLQASKIWLVGFYSLWVLLFPYLTTLLVAVALMDSWGDFRSRLRNMR